MPEAEVAAPPAPAVPAEVPAGAQAPVVVVPATVEQKADSTPAPSGENTDKPTDQEPGQPERKVSREQRRLNAAYRREAEHKARADFLAGELEKLKATATAGEKPAGTPRLEDFNYDPEEYAKALAKFESDRALSERDKQQRTETQREAARVLTTTWQERAAKAADEFDDFEEVVGDMKPTNPLAVAIMRAENGPHIAMYLAKNPAETAKIAALDPWDQFRAVGRLEAKLAADPPKPKPTKSAPEPVKPVGGAAGPSTKGLAEMSQAEFNRARRAQIAKRR